MKTTTKFRTMIAVLLAVFAVCAANAADAPPPLMVAETWACNYKDGKNYADKMKARDYMVAQMDKAGLQKTAAYHWTQTKGMAPVETVWFDVHDSIAAFGAASDAWDASGIGAGVNAQFAKVEDCTAGLSTLRVFHQMEMSEEAAANGEDKTLIVNLACGYKHGKGPQHLPDLTGHMGAVMAGYGENGPGFAAVRQPVTSGPNYPDVFLFSVFDNMSHWTRYVEQLFSTESGQSMRNHMDMVVDCDISMWEGTMVVTPDDA